MSDKPEPVLPDKQLPAEREEKPMQFGVEQVARSSLKNRRLRKKPETPAE